MMESELRLSDVTLELRTDHSDCIVCIDAIQIQQVLVNLIRNSLDAMVETECEQRTLQITSSRTADGMVEVAVSDTGKGVSLEITNELFDAFFSTKPEGMGMGLAISRTIVESHGGSLWMTANANHGVTFRFTIPTSAEETAEDATQESRLIAG